jgi:D-lyxose ketol-isomerase
MSRRELISGTAAVAGVSLASQLGTPSAAAQSRAKAKAVKTYTNADFYDSAGEFQADKAKEAYFDMFRRFGYAISETLKKGIWVLDFHLGDFANVGMAGIFWLNRQDYGYFGHEIYLLPGQMIPEHQHLATDKGPAKMESWQPRHGMIYTFGEGEPTPKFLSKIPASQRDIVKSRHCQPLKVDEVGDLNRREAWHFMVAGPEGALVTEYGTYHDMAGLRFSNPKAKL